MMKCVLISAHNTDVMPAFQLKLLNAIVHICSFKILINMKLNN